MSDPSPIYERFGALCQCVGELHTRCKREHRTVESLIDTFYHFHWLASAFREDCHEYLSKEPVTQELQTVVGDINMGLQCSIYHIQSEAERLNTTILDEIIRRLRDPSISTEMMN